MAVTGCGGGCFIGGGGCVFWTSGIVYMVILIVCLSQFGQKVDCVSFGKMLFNGEESCLINHCIVASSFWLSQFL